MTIRNILQTDKMIRMRMIRASRLQCKLTVFCAAVFVFLIMALLRSSFVKADPVTSCCESLEARIADLEASAARKGKSRLSLKISGLLNQGLWVFDDGEERNTYQTSNLYTGPRLRFDGSAKINADWTAGIRYYLNIISASSLTVTQNDANDQIVPGGVFQRRVVWYLDHKDWGRVSVGRTAPGIDNLFSKTTSNTFAASSVDFLLGANLAFRNSQTRQLTGITPFSLTGFLFTLRRNVMLYKSPNLNGLTLRVGYGADDVWGTSAEYVQTHGDFDVIAGVTYLSDTDATNGTGVEPDFVEIKGVLSAKHNPSGLFFDAVRVFRSFDEKAGGPSPNDFHYSYGRFGRQTSWNTLGPTTFYGEVGQINGGLEGLDTPAANALAGLGQTLDITKTQLNRWGLAVVQNIDAASTKIYAGYHNFDLDVETAAGALPTDPLQIIYTGAIIRF